jgi:hypothetical protein
VLAGAATRPRYWTSLNSLYLMRVLWVTLKYMLAMLWPRQFKSDNMRLSLLRGRLRGVILGWRSQASLRRDLRNLRRCLQEPLVDECTQFHSASGRRSREGNVVRQ